MRLRIPEFAALCCGVPTKEDDMLQDLSVCGSYPRIFGLWYSWVYIEVPPFWETTTHSNRGVGHYAGVKITFVWVHGLT